MSRLLTIAASFVLIASGCGSSGDVRADDPAGGSIAADTTTTSTTAAADATVSTTALSVTSTGADADESSITTIAPTTTVAPTTTASTVTPSTETADPGGGAAGSPQTVRIRFESMIADVSSGELAQQALVILNDPRGWIRAGFTFVADDNGPYRVVLAEGPTVDELCLPLMTYGTVSCQNGTVVALNADRWRTAVDHWVLGVEVYRGYLVNHEVGHLIGQRHPRPRCPVAGRPAGVMEQQTAGLEGCVGNPWPRDWEIAYAQVRPVVYAPLPDWGPDPVPSNGESNASSGG